MLNANAPDNANAESISHSRLRVVFINVFFQRRYAAFIIIGLISLFQGKQFLQPMLEIGQIGSLISAGTLPLLYLAVGLKVGAELAGLLAHIADVEADADTHAVAEVVKKAEADS